MIDKYDLYDLSAVLIKIRNNPQYDLNIKILEKIIAVLSDYEQYNDNQFRKALSSVEELSREEWYFVYHNNIYVNKSILKNKDIYDILNKLCNLLKDKIWNEQYDIAYDLSDCIHCLPIIIADNNFSVPKSYWRNYVKVFRDKWDKTFLLQEQKNLKS